MNNLEVYFFSATYKINGTTVNFGHRLLASSEEVAYGVGKQDAMMNEALNENVVLVACGLVE